jgi:structural maintenance of chromosomes protein 5
VRQAIKEQEESTRISLAYIQIGANKAALDEIIKRKDEKYQQALADFDKGMFPRKWLA